MPTTKINFAWAYMHILALGSIMIAVLNEEVYPNLMNKIFFHNIINITFICLWILFFVLGIDAIKESIQKQY